MEDVAGVIFLFLILGSVAGIIIYKYQKRRDAENKRQQELAERKRVEECGDVVTFFANHLGYVARQVISRDELEVLIDNGVSAVELSSEICSRIDRQEGLVLGYQPFSYPGVPVSIINK